MPGNRVSPAATVLSVAFGSAPGVTASSTPVYLVGTLKDGQQKASFKHWGMEETEH